MEKFWNVIGELTGVLLKLPLWGKMAVIGALGSLALAILPPVDKPFRLTYQINGITERDAHAEYTYASTFTNKFPIEYINTTDVPKVRDMVIILKEVTPEMAQDRDLYDEVINSDDTEVYFYRDEKGKRYDDWLQAVWDYKKDAARLDAIFAFLTTTSIALASYPGLVRRLISLIPR